MRYGIMFWILVVIEPFIFVDYLGSIVKAKGSGL